MKRVAWLTDIHLNFLDYIEVVTFIDRVLHHNPDAVVITGDIGEADTVVSYLKEFEKLLQKDIFFVLGNHDYYKGSISDVRLQVRVEARHSRHLRWMPDIGIAELTPTVGLIGHGSWPDGRYGDWDRSDLLLNDYFFIKEFNPDLVTDQHDSRQFWNPDGPVAVLLNTGPAKSTRLEIMQSLADEAAQHFQQYLPKALEAYDHVVVLMHAPPFREASWYKGKPSDDIWVPHFACRAVGEVLLQHMQNCPDKRLTVLCGHTHGKGEAQILPNLHVLTGDATYGSPKVQRVFEFEA